MSYESLPTDSGCLARRVAVAFRLHARTEAPNASSTPGNPSNIAAAVADSNRPEADKLRDANRKPVQTLEFLGVKPGEQIAELLPGGGYFTRIFSKAVGPSGHVYALVPERPANAPADMPDLAAKVKAIAADPNYPNVTVVIQPLSKLLTPVPRRSGIHCAELS